MVPILLAKITLNYIQKTKLLDSNNLFLFAIGHELIYNYRVVFYDNSGLNYFLRSLIKFRKKLRDQVFKSLFETFNVLCMYHRFFNVALN